MKPYLTPALISAAKAWHENKDKAKEDPFIHLILHEELVELGFPYSALAHFGNVPEKKRLRGRS